MRVILPPVMRISYVKNCVIDDSANLGSFVMAALLTFIAIHLL